MASTLLFVHGTGVRSPRYEEMLEQIQEKVAEFWLPVTVRGCFWGDAVGARLLEDGRSIPGYAATGGAGPTVENQRDAVWSLLYTDPWYELRLLRLKPVAGEAPIGEEPPAERLLQAIRSFQPSSDLSALLARYRLQDSFAHALAALRAAPELEEAAATAPSDPLEHRGAIARALIGFTLLDAEAAGRPPLDGTSRDLLVAQLTTDLHGYGLGVGEFLSRPFKGLAAHAATWKLTKDRGSITDDVAPLAGDILRYLAKPGAAQQFLRRAIEDCQEGPVHLLAHSLGGIISVDLLATQPIDTVRSLITVGSQVPFLYEIGALPSLPHGTPLPDRFPLWLNIYDRRDLLSYLGSGIFGTRVVDVEVDNGQPFPRSHSAYWTNDRFWAEITPRLQ